LLNPSLAVLRFAVVLAATLTWGAVQGQHAGQSPAPEAADSAIKAGITNFAPVTESLYRGGQPTLDGFKALAAMGMNIVVDLRGSRRRERELVTGLGMQYIALPWHCPFPQDAVFARFLALLEENPTKKVFVHCRLGDDRVGMMIAAYRMAEQGWPAAQAKAEMKARGFTALHHLICPGLAGYASSFPLRLNTYPAFQRLRRRVR